MLQTITNLLKFRLHATDGLIGTIKDCYFDDEKWTVRYLVIHTGSWLMGRDVLISPISVKAVDPQERLIHIAADQRTVENSPSIDTAEPISRRQEREFFQYYGWPYYWSGPAAWGVTGLPEPFPVVEPPPPSEWPHEESGEVHLRSAQEVLGYHIQAQDQPIGHVEDFIIDNASWTITDLLVDTRNWWPSKKVLIPHATVQTVSWIDRSIVVGLTHEQIQNAPGYESEEGLSPEYQEQVTEYYAHQPAHK